MSSPAPGHFPIPNSQFPIADHVRRDLHDILSQPDYNRVYGASPVDQAWRWIVEMFLRLVNWLGRLFGFGVEGAGRLVSIIFACLVILAFFWLLALVIRRLVGEHGAREDAGAVTSAGPYQLPSAGPLIHEAERFAGDGDYRGAFRSAYLASISRLDEAGALRFERSRTNWEYVRELAGRGLDQATGALRPLTLDFDRKIYGRESCTIEDYRSALDVYHIISGEVAA